MSQVKEIFTLFLGLVFTSLPFLLLGIVISSLLLVFVDEHGLAAKFPRNRFLGAIMGSSLGLILPVGQYGNIPVARRLLLQGVSPVAVFSFLVAAPTLNIFTLNLTWQFFRSSSGFIFYRFFSGWLMALVIGILFSFYQEKPPSADKENISPRTPSRLVRCGTFLAHKLDGDPLHRLGSLVYEYKNLNNVPKSPLKALQLLLTNIIAESLDLGWWLVFGCAIASLCQYFAPQSLLLSFSHNALTQILGMMLLGFFLSLGSVFNAFLPTTFMSFALPGSILSFLLFGSVFDLKSLPLFLVTFPLKIVFYLFTLSSLFTILVSLIVTYYIN
ncbi:MAG: putative two-component membrane permease complex subunit SMU_747c [Chroococcopsis gigantea SAG 12.99]|nr:permease [Chlorogloea purpurea SAG 13.99]MDV3001579.1 putative two-component membrane permease complex subunit SMU_747c [Chroococcopsis gigantea SAG 12.99]